MKTIKILSLFLPFFLMSTYLLGQVTTNKQKLLDFSATKTAEFSQKKAEAEAYARQNNLPMTIETDSTFMELMFIDDLGMPQYYVTSNVNSAKTISTNKVHPGSGYGYSLDGTGMTVHEWDAGAVLTTHQEFGSRVTQGDGATNTHYHSTHVAGTMIASGVDPDAKGMAPNASLRAFEWNNDNAEMSSEAAAGALVSNHSYGYARGWHGGYWYGDPSISTDEDYLFGFYDWNTYLWDQIAYYAPYYLIVKSAGNDRNDCGDGSYPCDGPYDCISQTGIAKNILTVGAVDDIPGGYTQPDDIIMSDFSSWGPADDGRIKPDIVANGISLYSTDDDSNDDYRSLSGTSMSAPSVSGSLILLQQHYEELHGSGNFMKAATLKALVIHTADEAGAYMGPDYEHGWGLMNTLRAVEIISHDNGNDTIIDEQTLTQGGTYQYSFTNTGTEPLQVTIIWTDPAAWSPPAPALDPPDAMLVNDLDLKVTESTNTFYPWKLDRDNPSDMPTNTTENDVDNVEVVFIENPVQNAVYNIVLDHDGMLAGGSQDFSIIISPVEKPAMLLLPPTSLSAVNFPATSAKLSWTENGSATNWEIRLDTAGFDTTGVATVLVSENPIIWEGLQPDTEYDWYVRSVCSGGKYSEWVGPDMFNTLSDNIQVILMQQKLLAEDGFKGDKFGMSVSMSGDYAIIGAPDNDDDNGATTGAAYIFYNNSGIWQQQAKLLANDGAAKDYFGCSVGIDGNYAVVGAYMDDDNGDRSGSAYIFYNNSGTWQQQAKLIADDGDEVDHFGSSVCIEGNYAIVGAIYDDDMFECSGSAYVFYNDSGTWQQQAKINTDDRTEGEIFFGRSVDLSGDYAIVGCGGDPILDTYSGFAYIFYNNSGVWEQQAKLIGDDVEKWGGFGKSVSISGDFAIVASDYDNGDTGSAYIFYNNSGIWQQQAKLFASDGLPGDKFGWSVNISGDYAIVGSSSGSTYLYFNNSGTWQQKAKLLTDDGDLYPGWSVSISGDYGIVSNPWSGTAYIFSPVIAPTDLSSSNFSATSAKLFWTENGIATNWEIMLVPSGSDTSGVTPVSVNENPYTWEGLTPETEYDWYVRADCGSNDYSEWVGPSTFSTSSEGILWANCYGGSAEDKANAMTATADGGYIIAGSTSSNDGDVSGNHGGSDFWIIKIDDSGDTIWTKTYGGSSDDIAHSIQPENNGGYIVAGNTQSHDGDLEGHDYVGKAIWIISIDDSGELIWENIYSSVPINDHPISILAVTDGGYIVTGATQVQIPAYDSDILVLKINSNGDILWANIYYEQDYYQTLRPNSLVELNDGGFLILGETYVWISQFCVPEIGLVLRLNSNGEKLWSQIIVNPGCDAEVGLEDIQHTMDGDFITAGHIYGFKGYSKDFIVVKLNEQGEIDWRNSLDLDGYKQANSILQNSDSSFIIAGSSYTYSWDYLILKLNKMGALITFKELGGSNTEIAMSVLQTDDGGYIVAGYTESNDGDVYGNHGSSDFWVVKLDEEFFNKLNPTTLPFTEDWETFSGELKTNDTIRKGEHYNWTFETDVQNQGRVRWGSDAYMAFGGDGALTFDKTVGNGSNAMSSATLTLNLSAYINDNVYLSFRWADHNDEEHAGDKVWVRGSDTDEWIEIYDFNPQQFTDNAFHDVNDLNISAALASASPAQSFSPTFQLRFGQQDNYWADHDGISIDNIMITDEPMFELMPVSLPFIENWEAYSGLVKVDSTVYLSTYAWSFETDVQNQGRARWGTQAYMASGGSGALTFDKVDGNGSNALNYAILTLNMDNYVTSDLYLTFRWADHNDEDHAGDKVWVRGSDSDKWVEIYDFNPQKFTDNAFHDVNDLNISSALAAASPAQTVSSSFQLRFGQQDNYWANYDGITIDNIVVSEAPIHEITATSLPFVEDWEDYSGEQKTDTVFYQDTYSWAFETDIQGQGRASYGTDAYMPNSGVGAITLDKASGSGDNALNHAILTLNLADYVASSDLELSFFWADHNDENHGGDKVWVRGSDTDQWVELVYLAPQSAADNVYQFVEGIDIDATLAVASPTQEVSETFQIRFGQQDNFWADHDGISYDDIVVQEISDKSVESSDISDGEGDFNIYYSDSYVYIRSNGNAITEQKQVIVYDLYGRTIVNQTIPPGPLSKIKVLPCSCYMVVKVLGKQQLKVEKVFVK